MRAFFVTGTDTEVGKTTVSCALLVAVSRRGLQTGAMKPVESGCARGADGRLIPSDAVALQAATSMNRGLEEICLYCFEEPVAPGVAAARAGTRIDLGRIQAGFDLLRGRAPDFVIIEGAGGLLVPLGGGRVIADLVAALGLPLLIVGRPGLGTINHTLLTIEVARVRGIVVEGVIFSDRRGDIGPEVIESNAAEIEGASGVAYLGCLPKLGDLRQASMARVAEQSLRVSALVSPG